ncbi:hypothetical protein POM88_018292 [Heracleum sosnowskyi]|uniref:Uncharacterized protein n=1 Tax=Heracleum sosnowskyi TaxID=360622 RepID=A0AAD8IQ91_9APIA|nr:hypothetical protein POM88_018292 [Heracleum sosnowskyi]
MADAVVEFLLENLKQLLLYNVDLISGVKEQVESLYRELSLMNAFLRDSKEKRSQYEVVREIVRQIRDVAYEAEDIIDNFIVTAALQRTRNRISRIVHVLDSRNIARDIELIKTRIKEIYGTKKFGIEFLQGGESSTKRSPQKRVPVVEEDNVVGFDEEAKTVVDRLTTGSKQLEVISVVGMGGLGKTTLAKKIYTDRSIEYHFFIRAWVYVSQDYSRKEVFLAILGKEEKFLKVIEPNFQDVPMVAINHRRLCIHSHVLDYIRSKPSNPHVRSFLCFAIEEIELPREQTSFIHEAFKLVRVLDVRSICLYRFPSDIVQLLHLRYVAIFGNFKVLPASICKLWNLQTLIVETTERELDIQVDIWKMLQFRHLHTSGSSRLHGPPPKTRKQNEDPFVRRNMQTISTISPESCTENVLARTPNLKKLGIRGKLLTLMEEKGGSSMFDNFAKLGNLETLKLLNDTFPLSPFQANLNRLPQWYKFPPSLKKLTFSDTLLDWKNMSTIGMLPNLEILKLKEKAFIGEHWESLDGGFRLLKVLQLGRTDLVRWDASSHHFPRLERVVLKHCEKLQAVPYGLGGVSALKMLELYWPTPSAADSARLIQQQQHDMMNNGFKLLVYPPDR